MNIANYNLNKLKVLIKNQEFQLKENCVNVCNDTIDYKFYLNFNQNKIKGNKYIGKDYNELNSSSIFIFDCEQNEPKQLDLQIKDFEISEFDLIIINNLFSFAGFHYSRKILKLIIDRNKTVLLFTTNFFDVLKFQFFKEINLLEKSVWFENQFEHFKNIQNLKSIKRNFKDKISKVEINGKTIILENGKIHWLPKEPKSLYIPNSVHLDETTISITNNKIFIKEFHYKKAIENIETNLFTVNINSNKYKSTLYIIEILLTLNRIYNKTILILSNDYFVMNICDFMTIDDILFCDNDKLKNINESNSIYY